MRKTVVVSDLSGEELEAGKGAVITIRYEDARRGTFVLEVSAAEADDLAKHGRKVVRRGRKAKSD